MPGEEVRPRRASLTGSASLTECPPARKKGRRPSRAAIDGGSGMAEPRNGDGDGEAESRPRRSSPRPKKAGAAKKRAVQPKRGLAAASLGCLYPAPGKPTHPPPGPPRPADLAVGAAVGLA